MYINTISGDDTSFRAIAYGYEKHPGTLSFIESTMNNVSNVLTAGGQTFLSNARTIYDNLNGSYAMQLARAAINKVGNMFTRTDIHEIREIDRMQNANLIMQRYIMANPEVRGMFQSQLCNGYSDTYVDMEPGKIGENHYDYRRVMNGIVKEDKADDGEYMSSYYLDELAEGDRELMHDEQVSIMKTWEEISYLMKHGKSDPTDPLNGSL
jgi:hypothetical protein